jgi:hypothetical protein
MIGVGKNITLAKLLYEKAGELEDVYTKYGLSWATTNGAAPYLAGALASLELWIDPLLQSLPIEAMKTTKESLLSDGLLVTLSATLLVLGLLRFLRYRLR